MNIIAALRTPVATLIVLCMALLAQLPHAADVFRMIVAGEGLPAVLHGYAYAVALELAVLLFVVQRRDAESYLFACVSVLVNLSYYYLHGIALFSVAALPAWLVSIALPAAIARYSHLLVESPASATHDADTLAAADDTPAVDTPGDATTGDTVDSATVAPAHAPSPASEPQTGNKERALLLAGEGLTAAQIAQELSVNANTVRSWLRRATEVHTNGKVQL